MMPYQKEYYLDNVNLKNFISTLKHLSDNYYLNKKTIELVSKVEIGSIDKFLNFEKGLNNEELDKISNTIYSIKNLFENLENINDKYTNIY